MRAVHSCRHAVVKGKRHAAAHLTRVMGVGEGEITRHAPVKPLSPPAMVFGLFSRKREPQPLPEDSNPSSPTPAQLRTPSPSVDSASIGKQRGAHSEPPATPSPPPDSAQKSEDLLALIQSIPAPTLHCYALAQLRPDTTIHPETLAHLSTFFADLTPPPRLHCVRCHKSFFEVENTDRSCLVPHDDDSAEVERVSSKAQGKSTQYETLWGCCGRTVEGDGDMGPPDGWCYEGKHTVSLFDSAICYPTDLVHLQTDLKRARFRADSTLQDDKLTSCTRLRCGEPPRSSRKTRKRNRTAVDDTEEDEGAQSTASESVLSTSPRSSTGPKRRRTAKMPRARAPASASADEAEPVPGPSTQTQAEMDVDKPTPASPKPKSKAKPRPKSRVRAKPSTPASKSFTAPQTSSPLVLSPPFVSHSVSPEPPEQARVIVNMKPRSTRSHQQLRPRASAASLRSKTSPTKLGAMDPPSSPPRTRKNSAAAAAAASPSVSARVPRSKGKAKSLVEVVDSSIDAERRA
ncbi:hypothetical protein H0H81_001925 [Sphagnurus paluster]|uniref:Uncharacterized protein n=1 Tax=Sphagnurus paluster TaxID=117069 RepID=A0A9P7FVS0_9AGAR|nr:hypothetical protein H0H81_001925 [Sphagnurus paluster]